MLSSQPAAVWVIHSCFLSSHPAPLGGVQSYIMSSQSTSVVRVLACVLYSKPAALGVLQSNFCSVNLLL